MPYLFNFDVIVSLDLLPTKNLCPKRQEKVFMNHFKHARSDVRSVCASTTRHHLHPCSDND